MVPSKTKKQLYDFFRTCFSKVLFDAQISREDKLAIEQLNQARPEMKPAALAELFLEESGRNLLKHDVVMQFVNLRRQLLK